jgi:hypothetical protein
MLSSSLLAQGTANEALGQITKPQGVAQFDAAAGGGIGLLVFISTLIQIFTVVAGVWVFFQFLMAGYEFLISNGDTAAYGKARDRITMSVLGLIIITAAYTIAALVGLLFFGDATYILNPQIFPAAAG